MATTIFSIVTPQGPKPYFSKFALLAHDFQRWGYRVSDHDSESSYIKETRVREEKIDLAGSRPTVYEIWAQEIVRRRRLNQTAPAVPDTCLHRVSEMLHDFIGALATQGESEEPRSLGRNAAKCFVVKDTPLPDDPGLNLVTVAMRLLTSVQHGRNISLADISGVVMNHVELEFRHHDWLGKHLENALEKVKATQGRWVKEPEIQGKWVRIRMAVDVRACIDMRQDGNEPLPLYESVGPLRTDDGEGEDGGDRLPSYESIQSARANGGQPN